MMGHNPTDLTGVSGLGKRGKGTTARPNVKPRLTASAKRQMPGIARRLPSAFKGNVRREQAARKSVNTVPAPAPAVVMNDQVMIPPASSYTPAEYIGTPMDASPQAAFDQIATGTDDGVPVDLSTDTFADATAPEGEMTDLEMYATEEWGDLNGVQGLGFLKKIGKMISRNKNSILAYATGGPAGLVTKIAADQVKKFGGGGGGAQPAPAPAPAPAQVAPVMRMAPPAPKPAPKPAAAPKPQGLSKTTIVVGGVAAIGVVLALASLLKSK